MTPRLDVHDRGAVYAEVQHFYARQIRQLDAADVDGFASTFTPDGLMWHASSGASATGPAEIAATLRANFARHTGVVPRHWFDKLLIEPAGEDELHVSYYALLSLTAADGSVSFQPTCLVDDVLVITADGALRTRSRRIHRDDLLLSPVVPTAPAQAATAGAGVGTGPA
ncbi:nuclear transport factor 2 family protein [Frankia sp. R82]|uniref:nuclear transport factor 2 family protein n=1 Tax=Frankia sp. R82 TaxID=2950553 RepID=UPI0020434394|nr:nuclear transport factor 2 family protein [Frankia sp. R82]MCM3882373.1 nuclear transport factor 2 family protein [Frankia sp. R82]